MTDCIHAAGVTWDRNKCVWCELDRLRVENETLKAAISTPEVYAGVITQIVEAERDKAVEENIRLHREIATAHENGRRAGLEEAANTLEGRASGRGDPMHKELLDIAWGFRSLAESP